MDMTLITILVIVVIVVIVLIISINSAIDERKETKNINALKEKELIHNIMHNIPEYNPSLIYVSNSKQLSAVSLDLRSKKICIIKDAYNPIVIDHKNLFDVLFYNNNELYKMSFVLADEVYVIEYVRVINRRIQMEADENFYSICTLAQSFVGYSYETTKLEPYNKLYHKDGYNYINEHEIVREEDEYIIFVNSWGDRLRDILTNKRVIFIKNKTINQDIHCINLEDILDANYERLPGGWMSMEFLLHDATNIKTAGWTSNIVNIFQFIHLERVVDKNQIMKNDILGVIQKDMKSMSLECYNCNSPIQGNDNFCGNCGANLNACYSCNSPIQSNDNFCGNCGANLSSNP
ncbi:MAG: hypothetical protein ETSY1_33715 [Candidatus Entotheonella factor]|uniref:DZANK-type domain-containing protein n=1 Tax=Entotheonella factor TaxID=1429438 RepID=W4LBL5_ENTF1|nr:MAG: hypothetical protein ETSY1_33715 [Candidatus Entotheonella factor]